MQEKRRLINQPSIHPADSVNSEEMKLALRYDPGSDSAHSSFTDGRNSNVKHVDSKHGSKTKDRLIESSTIDYDQSLIQNAKIEGLSIDSLTRLLESSQGV